MTERLPPTPAPLAPEERALAARLARMGPHGEPSPMLDARILAAARAELPAAAAPARKAPRWPLAFGIAASVALAVGLAWQLRPLPEPVAYDEAASAVGMVASSSEAAPGDVESPVAAPQAADAAAATATVASEPAAAPKPVAAPASAPAPEPARERAPAAFQRTAEPATTRQAAREAVADGVHAEPQPVRRLPPPPAPPAPAVLQAPVPVEAEAGVAADMALPAPPPAAPAAGAAKAAAPMAPTQPAVRDATARRRAASAAAAAESNVFAEPDVEDIPPATADSPSVRDAWLHRIRELHAAGDIDAARASLDEFVRRYPGFQVPDDLQPLLD